MTKKMKTTFPASTPTSRALPPTRTKMILAADGVNPWMIHSSICLDITKCPHQTIESVMINYQPKVSVHGQRSILSSIFCEHTGMKPSMAVLARPTLSFGGMLRLGKRVITEVK